MGTCRGLPDGCGKLSKKGKSHSSYYHIPRIAETQFIVMYITFEGWSWTLGIVYVNDILEKRFMRMDELAKFSTGTVRWVLDEV